MNNYANNKALQQQKSLKFWFKQLMENMNVMGI